VHETGQHPPEATAYVCKTGVGCVGEQMSRRRQIPLNTRLEHVWSQVAKLDRCGCCRVQMWRNLARRGTNITFVLLSSALSARRSTASAASRVSACWCCCRAAASS